MESPDIDNLYLDMNGIIHNCTHDNEGKSICNEDEMVSKIFTYLQKLVQIVKPRKVLFMAIDGELLLCYLLVYRISYINSQTLAKFVM